MMPNNSPIPTRASMAHFLGMNITIGTSLQLVEFLVSTTC